MQTDPNHVPNAKQRHAFMQSQSDKEAKKSSMPTVYMKYYTRTRHILVA